MGPLSFLRVIDCPYYPPFYGNSALAWLKQTQAILFSEHFGLQSEAPPPSAKIPELDSHQILNSHQYLYVSELPLHFPYILLEGYLPLGGHTALRNVALRLEAVTIPIGDYAGQLAEVIALSAHITPLQEVQT